VCLFTYSNTSQKPKKEKQKEKQSFSLNRVEFQKPESVKILKLPHKLSETKFKARNIPTT